MARRISFDLAKVFQAAFLESFSAKRWPSDLESSRLAPRTRPAKALPFSTETEEADDNYFSDGIEENVVETWDDPETNWERWQPIVAVIRAYCQRVFRCQPTATWFVREESARPLMVYRIEVHIHSRHRVVFLILDDGQILQFPPRRH